MTGICMFRRQLFGPHALAERDLDRAADEIDAGVQRNLAGAEKPAGEPRREFDHIGLALVDDDVALDGAVASRPVRRPRARPHRFTLVLCLHRARWLGRSPPFSMKKGA